MCDKLMETTITAVHAFLAEIKCRNEGNSLELFACIIRLSFKKRLQETHLKVPRKASKKFPWEWPFKSHK